MKLFIFIFLFLFLSTRLSAQCKDSSLRLKYSFNEAPIYIQKFKQGSNNGHLLGGHITHPYNSDYVASMMFGKTNSSGRLLWAKYANRTSFPENCMIQEIEETSTSIYWGGQFTGGYNKPFILKTDQAGNILGAFIININYGGGNIETELKKIKYISDDEIYLLISVSSSDSFLPFNIVTRLKSDGSVIWSKALNTGIGLNTYNGRCTDVYRSFNELIILGHYYKANSLEDKRGIIKTKLNSNDGSVIESKSFYIPQFNVSQARYSNSEDFKLIPIPNGFCFSSIALKINMDTNLSITKIKRIVSTDLNLSGFTTSIGTNNLNESCITISNNYDYYYCFLNSKDSLIKTKRLKYPFKRPIDFHGGLVFDNDGSISQIIAYNVDPFNKFELVKLSRDWPNSTDECMGVEVSPKVNVEPVDYSVSDFTWEGTATNIVQTEAMSLLTFDITMQDEIICKEELACSAIRLTAPDTICDITQPILIKAHKNQSCLKKVNFTFDSTAVNSYSQPDDTTLVLSFNNSWSGKIYASVTSCTTILDSVQLTVNKPLLSIDLGEDVSYCAGKNYSFNAHAGYKQYRWQDGSNDSMFIATVPGRYFITAIDYCNRTYSDTVIISDATFSLYAGKDTSICLFEKLQLSATQGFSKYTWTPAYRISNTVDNTVTVSPEITTSYSVSAEKFPGCVLKDTITVTIKDCPNHFFVPNAFSPNRDSKNDIFKPIITGSISNYEFNVYNRWGQRVFRSTDKDSGWDGTLKGLNQSGNVFVWVCKYKFSNEELQTKKGTVVLIR